MSDSPPDSPPPSDHSSGHSSDRAPDRATRDEARSTVKEIGVMYLAALALILACVFVASAVPFVSQNLYALVAAVFVGLPYWWLGRRGEDFERFGLTWERAGRGVVWGLAFTALTLAPFAAGYWWWQTQIQEQRYEFGLDNFFKWPVEYQGRPATWGEHPGVFVWSEGVELHVGVKTKDQPVAIDLEADRAFRPGVIGRARLLGPAAPQGSEQWTVQVPAGGHRSHLVISREGLDGTPREVDLVAHIQGTDEPVTVFQGPSKTAVGAEVDLDRGLWWMLLWILTQLVFIALPEEFFYRGYLQTKLEDVLAARRKRSASIVDESAAEPAGDEAAAPGRRRRLMGISASNALTSALFAAGHLLIPIGGVLLVSRVSVFFPSLLFGWLRERTGTIAAPVVYHAGANLLVLFAAPHFF